MKIYGRGLLFRTIDDIIFGANVIAHRIGITFLEYEPSIADFIETAISNLVNETNKTTGEV